MWMKLWRYFFPLTPAQEKQIAWEKMHIQNQQALINKSWETGEVWMGEYDKAGNWVMTPAREQYSTNR